MGRSHRRSNSRDRDKYRDRDDKPRNRDLDRDRDYYRSRKKSKKSYRRSSSYSSDRSSRSVSRSRSSRSHKKNKKSYRRSSSSSSGRSSRSVSRTRSRSHKSQSKTRGASSDKYVVIASTSSALHSTSKPMKSLDILENRLNSEILGSIDEDSFTPQTFVSSGGSKSLSNKVYINLNNETMAVPVPEVKTVEPTEDSIFNPQFLGDETTKMDKWVKKLYNYRKREAFL